MILPVNTREAAVEKLKQAGVPLRDENGKLLPGSYLRSSSNVPMKAIEKAKQRYKLELLREHVLDSLLNNPAADAGDRRTMAERVLMETLATNPAAVLKTLEKFATITIDQEAKPETKQVPEIHITMPNNIQINT